METPVMSLGRRSGVNWTRRTEQSTDRASAFASMVLPTPGTSSMSRWPSASITVIASRTVSRLPSMTLSTARRIRVVVSDSAARPALSGRPILAGRSSVLLSVVSPTVNGSSSRSPAVDRCDARPRFCGESGIPAGHLGGPLR
jgi:hypothetical protein